MYSTVGLYNRYYPYKGDKLPVWVLETERIEFIERDLRYVPEQTYMAVLYLAKVNDKYEITDVDNPMKMHETESKGFQQIMAAYPQGYHDIGYSLASSAFVWSKLPEGALLMAPAGWGVSRELSNKELIDMVGMFGPIFYTKNEVDYFPVKAETPAIKYYPKVPMEEVVRNSQLAGIYLACILSELRDDEHGFYVLEDIFYPGFLLAYRKYLEHHCKGYEPEIQKNLHYAYEAWKWLFQKNGECEKHTTVQLTLKDIDELGQATFECSYDGNEPFLVGLPMCCKPGDFRMFGDFWKNCTTQMLTDLAFRYSYDSYEYSHCILSNAQPVHPPFVRERMPAGTKGSLRDPVNNCSVEDLCNILAQYDVSEEVRNYFVGLMQDVMMLTAPSLEPWVFVDDTTAEEYEELKKYLR